MSDFDVPTSFKSFEEMEKFLKDKNKKPLTKKKSRSTKPSERDKATSNKKLEKPPIPDEEVWQVIHIYTRPGRSFHQTCSEAKDEAGMRNDNVRVIAHEHDYGTDCSDGACKVIREN